VAFPLRVILALNRAAVNPRSANIRVLAARLDSLVNVQHMSEPLGTGVEEPQNRNGAFPRLSDEQRGRLRELGEARAIETGDLLWRAGDTDYDFYVVESGVVAIVQGLGAENRVLAVHGPHRFLGELNLLTGATVQLSAVVRDPGEVIRLPAARLRELVTEGDELGNLILAAYLARRAILIDVGGGVKVIGSRYSPEARHMREFLARNRAPFLWMDLEQDEEAGALLGTLGIPPGETPVVISGNEVLRRPSNGELASRLGLGSRGAPPPMCDLVIVGGGPAGLAAAVYGASEGLDTQAIDAVAFGGQASTSSRIENYLGFPTGISGSELAERAVLQAAKFGARLVVPAEAAGFSREDGHYAVRLDDGDVVNGRTIIVATGARYRKLDVANLDRYEGEGVYYAATQAEAQMCSGSSVAVVGGGNSAGQAALFMAAHAERCHLLVRGPELGRSMSHYLVEEIERHEHVEVMTSTEVVELEGERALEGIVIADSGSGARTALDVQALFVFIGASPHTEWLNGVAAGDDHGFLLTGRDLQEQQLGAYNGQRPLFLETSQPGVFAVGDVHSGSVKRVASAVGEGSMAVQLVHRRLAAV